VHLIKVGQYKSAAEPYVLNQASDASKEADRYWMGGLWQDYLAEVTGLRKIEATSISEDIAHYDERVAAHQGDLAKLALEQKLVDQLATRADARSVGRYIPLRISERARQWMENAFVGGVSNDVKLRLKGNLNEFPFPEGKGGLFQVTARVTDGVLEDPRHCTFDPAVLQCKGADAPDCLTQDQVASVRKLWAGADSAVGAAGKLPHRGGVHPRQPLRRGILVLRERPAHHDGRHAPGGVSRSARRDRPQFLQKGIRCRRHPAIDHRSGERARAGTRFRKSDQNKTRFFKRL